MIRAKSKPSGIPSSSFANETAVSASGLAATRRSRGRWMTTSLAAASAIIWGTCSSTALSVGESPVGMLRTAARNGNAKAFKIQITLRKDKKEFMIIQFHEKLRASY